MDQPTIAGLLALGVPLLLAALALRRSTPIALFYLALVLVGLGYLYVSGAVADIGNFVLDTIGMGTAPVTPDVPPAEPMPAPAPAP